MTMIKFTLDAGNDLLGVFLHPPGQAKPIPLPGINHSVTLDLDPGVYAVACSGTGLAPGTRISLKIETQVNSISRSNRVKADGTIIAWFTFELLGTGEVT